MQIAIVLLYYFGKIWAFVIFERSVKRRVE